MFARVGIVAVVGEDFPARHRELFEGRGVDLSGLETSEGSDAPSGMIAKAGSPGNTRKIRKTNEIRMSTIGMVSNTRTII